MTATDSLGLALTGASDKAAALYGEALDAYHCYSGPAFPRMMAALADSPGFVMGQVLKGYMTLVGGDRATRAMGEEALAALDGVRGDAREQGHVAAVRAIGAGEFRQAARILEDVAIAEPRDLLALQAGQFMDFLTGDARMLRDRIARARPAWTPDMPNYHAILGLHAFGLEETGLYDRAEAAGREAVARQPRNAWAQHAVAHVLEMQDRRAEGVAWMRADPDAWSRDSFFAVHNWWHLTLFHLGLGEIAEALAVYDGQIRGGGSTMSFDLVDASALLWRLKLADVDVGDRWAPLADAWAGQAHGALAFDDAHAMMAYVGAERDADAQALLATMTAAAEGPGDAAEVMREVGLPVAGAIRAFGAGDAARAVALLRDVRSRAARFGGSHAQRDLLDLTLIAAAARAGETSLERALRAERAA